MGFVIPPQYLITTPQSICYYDYREAENVCVKKVAAGIKQKKNSKNMNESAWGYKNFKRYQLQRENEIIWVALVTPR